MNLKAYIANKNMTLKQFAALVECDHQYLGLIAKGRKIPSKKLMRKIISATNGEVNIPVPECKAALQGDVCQA